MAKSGRIVIQALSALSTSCGPSDGEGSVAGASVVEEPVTGGICRAGVTVEDLDVAHRRGSVNGSAVIGGQELGPRWLVCFDGPAAAPARSRRLDRQLVFMCSLGQPPLRYTQGRVAPATSRGVR
jgi:hypothetical protein